MKPNNGSAAAPSAAPQRPKKKRSEINRRRFSHSVLLMLGVAVILTFLCNLISPTHSYSDSENRSLAGFPALSLSDLADGTWGTGVKNWYNDQFFARDGWISLHLSELRLLGMKESGEVYLGKQGRLLGKPETPDEAALGETTAAIAAFAAAHPDLSTVMITVPDAAAIQPQYLPSNAPVRDQLTDIQNLSDTVSAAGITCVDASAVLQEHSEEEIYYKTDHHWTSLGAYYTLEAAADALGIRDTLTEFDVCTVTDSFEGTLASKSGSHRAKDSIDVYFPVTDITWYAVCGEDGEKTCSVYSSAALEEKDKYQVFFGGNYSQVDIHTTAGNGRTLLVFKDSYANCLIPMLLPCYERVIMIDPRYFYGSLDSFLNEGVTDVLYLYSADTLLVDTSLKDVLTSEPPAADEATVEEKPEAPEMPAGTEDSGETSASESAVESSDSEEASAESASAEDAA